MEVVADALSWVFLMSGSFFIVVGGIGLLRLPDFYTRIHAAGITDTIGAALILIGLTFQAGFTLITVKLLLVLIFIVLTSPTAGHALAKAAFLSGMVPLLATEDAE